jgi:hypothetical protein
MSRRSEDSSGRWWEIRNPGQPDGGYRNLVTDSQGRGRPERSLSVGADLVDQPGHSSRAFLWPIASVVAAVGLIVSVIYGVSTTKSTPSEGAKSPQAATRGDTHDVVGLTPDSGVKPFVPPAPLINSPIAGSSTLPPIGGRVGAAPGTAVIPNAPAASPAAPAGTPSDSSIGAAGDSGNQPTGAPASSAPAPAPASSVTLDGPAPAAPGTQQAGSPAPGKGGCSKAARNDYACTITQAAPVYLPGTTDSPVTVPANRYPFLCQSDGSRYSIGRRTNHCDRCGDRAGVGAGG